MQSWHSRLQNHAPSAERANPNARSTQFRPVTTPMLSMRRRAPSASDTATLRHAWGYARRNASSRHELPAYTANTSGAGLKPAPHSCACRKNITTGRLPDGLQKTFGIDGRHAARTNRGYRLAVGVVLHITAGEHAGHAGFGG